MKQQSYVVKNSTDFSESPRSSVYLVSMEGIGEYWMSCVHDVVVRGTQARSDNVPAVRLLLRPIRPRGHVVRRLRPCCRRPTNESERARRRGREAGAAAA